MWQAAQLALDVAHLLLVCSLALAPWRLAALAKTSLERKECWPLRCQAPTPRCHLPNLGMASS